jgi:hypothetical protein
MPINAAAAVQWKTSWLILIYGILETVDILLIAQYGVQRQYNF